MQVILGDITKIKADAIVNAASADLMPHPGICSAINGNQRIIAGNAQFAGIAAGRGVRFTTGLLLLGKGLGMRETPIRPHSWH